MPTSTWNLDSWTFELQTPGTFNPFWYSNSADIVNFLSQLWIHCRVLTLYFYSLFITLIF